MTPLLHSSPTKRAVLGAVAALSIAAPAAGASGIDPSVYDTGVAPGTVIHGVESYTVTGSAKPTAQRIEYWVGAQRWREQTTDAKTGKLLNARIQDADGTTWFSVNGPSGRPDLEHDSGQDSVPGPGWPAPYNKKLLAGLRQSNATHQWTSSLRAIGPVTLAGIAGTKYELLTNGAPEAGGNQHTYLTLDADAQPLERESTLANGKGGGTFDQKETLISRELLPASAATSRLSAASFRASVRSWKVRAARKHQR